MSASALGPGDWIRYSAERHIREREHALVVRDDEREAAERRNAYPRAGNGVAVDVEHAAGNGRARFQRDRRTHFLSRHHGDLRRAATPASPDRRPGSRAVPRRHPFEPEEAVGVGRHERKPPATSAPCTGWPLGIEDDALHRAGGLHHDADGRRRQQAITLVRVVPICPVARPRPQRHSSPRAVERLKANEPVASVCV